MRKYYSTFAAGFENLAARFLEADLPGVKNIKKMEGALAYEADAEPDDIKAAKYFKNTFAVLREFAGKSLEEMGAMIGGAAAPKAARTFKLVVSDSGELVSMDGAAKAKLVDSIGRQSGLSYRVGAGDIEYWLLRRADGSGFFMRRLTKTHAAPAAGELEPHVAMLLVRASEPVSGEKFIDPFCGHGSIPLARSRIGKYRAIFALDIDAQEICALRSRIRALKNARVKKSLFVKHLDFFENRFIKKYADAIVTDPPWGKYGRVDADFYGRMMIEMERILRPGGKLVILTAREIKLPLPPLLEEKESHDVLIHGKKASVRLFARVR
ncbi:MAG: methyltransferase [Rickettsiales bacterium]|jgi:23S rRNA G2445 N2-methylase RlmL|nr:methyltransferase [Rickettsiales bacterium]